MPLSMFALRLIEVKHPVSKNSEILNCACNRVVYCAIFDYILVNEVTGCILAVFLMDVARIIATYAFVVTQSLYS